MIFRKANCKTSDKNTRDSEVAFDCPLILQPSMSSNPSTVHVLDTLTKWHLIKLLEVFMNLINIDLEIMDEESFEIRSPF
jgi:hypothetical protein